MVKITVYIITRIFKPFDDIIIMKLLHKPLLPSTKMIPILQKYKIMSTSSLKPLSTYHKVCLSVIVPHATTDVLITPNAMTYANYLFSFLFFSVYDIRMKYILFLIHSIYHIRNDIQGSFIVKILYSIIIHSSWVYFPEFSLSYLAWIHTFIHYYKSFPMITTTAKVSMACLTFIIYFIINNIDINDFVKKEYWMPCVIGHIINVN